MAFSAHNPEAGLAQIVPAANLTKPYDHVYYSLRQFDRRLFHNGAQVNYFKDQQAIQFSLSTLLTTTMGFNLRLIQC
jgi:hypothetical protein